ncbi:MAG TPA: cupin domain-containing protein [Alphaproteobacteria bacterium]
MIEPQTIIFQVGDDVPNNPRLSVLIYRAALDSNASDLPDRMEHLFQLNDWRGNWRNGIFNYHHFHPNAHEVLGIAAGNVDVKLGGEKGEVITLKAGDIVVLPAGTGHKRVSDKQGLVVIGGYPKGQEDYDICKSLEECPGAQKRISEVPLPKKDPVYGENGPLISLWANAGA